MLSQLALVALNCFILVACATVEKQQRTIYSTNIEADKTIAIQQAFPGLVLCVATLDLAHGRKDSFNQLFVLEVTFKENLGDIAGVLSDYIAIV